MLLEDIRRRWSVWSWRCSASAWPPITGNGVYDGLGTVAIGLLLVVIAVILAIETKSLLLGESATPEDQRKIVAALEGGPLAGVGHPHEDAAPRPRRGARGGQDRRAAGRHRREEIARYIDAAERRIRAAVPIARVIYLEPDLRRAGPATAAPGTHGV